MIPPQSSFFDFVDLFSGFSDFSDFSAVDEDEEEEEEEVEEVSRLVVSNANNNGIINVAKKNNPTSAHDGMPYSD